MKTLREVLSAIIVVSAVVTVLAVLLTIIWAVGINLFIKVPLSVLLISGTLYLSIVWRELITKK